MPGSAWLKLHYPAAFTAALLNAQPMGFWSTNTIVADARRQGVTVLGPDVNASAATATLEVPAYGGCDRGYTPASTTRTEPCVRLGLDYVRNVGDDLAARIADGRPYASIEDVVRRTGAPQPAVEALATAGAFGCFDVDRREELWAAGAA